MAGNSNSYISECSRAVTETKTYEKPNYVCFSNLFPSFLIFLFPAIQWACASTYETKIAGMGNTIGHKVSFHGLSILFSKPWLKDSFFEGSALPLPNSKHVNLKTISHVPLSEA